MTTTICGQTEGTLCDVCNRCSICDRKLNATPHVFVCACPEPHPIDLCPECRAKETAFQLTRTREDANRPHFWSSVECPKCGGVMEAGSEDWCGNCSDAFRAALLSCTPPDPARHRSAVFTRHEGGRCVHGPYHPADLECSP